LREQEFAWWINRVKASLQLYDILRIDHFRGFAGYYVIPYGDETAKGGWWEPAPGKALFDAIKEALPGAKIIAEDLGFITDDVRELLDHTGFPGMKVLQFAFYNDDSDSLPRTYKNGNVVVYSGSHDADCTASWCKSLKGENLKRFRKECLQKYGADGRSRTLAVITMAMKSTANLAMIPMQDYLGLSNEEGRMNVPSVAQGNWTWRLKANYATDEMIEKILSVTREGKREYIKK
jgi:4-alpha-glucanotransferase